MNITILSQQVANVAPIDGINSDGAIWFKPEATEEQRLAAQSVVDNYSSKSQGMAAELATLQAEYKSDITQLDLSWLTATRNDGASEVSKKAVIDSKVTARNAKLAADKSSIIAKYA